MKIDNIVYQGPNLNLRITPTWRDKLKILTSNSIPITVNIDCTTDELIVKCNIGEPNIKE